LTPIKIGRQVKIVHPEDPKYQDLLGLVRAVHMSNNASCKYTIVLLSDPSISVIFSEEEITPIIDANKRVYVSLNQIRFNNRAGAG